MSEAATLHAVAGCPVCTGQVSTWTYLDDPSHACCLNCQWVYRHKPTDRLECAGCEGPADDIIWLPEEEMG